MNGNATRFPILRDEKAACEQQLKQFNMEVVVDQPSRQNSTESQKITLKQRP